MIKAFSDLCLGLGLITLSVSTFADEAGRDDWTSHTQTSSASVIATYGYEAMKVIDAGTGTASVVFTHINDREYCGGQDAIFVPITAKINVELAMNNQLTTLSLPAFIGCERGVSFAQIHDVESMQLIAMMYDAQRVFFHDQSYSLKGFERAAKHVIH